jgi:hypothetical protein
VTLSSRRAHPQATLEALHKLTATLSPVSRPQTDDAYFGPCLIHGPKPPTYPFDSQNARLARWQSMGSETHREANVCSVPSAVRTRTALGKHTTVSSSPHCETAPDPPTAARDAQNRLTAVMHARPARSTTPSQAIPGLRRQREAPGHDALKPRAQALFHHSAAAFRSPPAWKLSATAAHAFPLPAVHALTNNRRASAAFPRRA